MRRVCLVAVLTAALQSCCMAGTSALATPDTWAGAVRELATYLGRDLPASNILAMTQPYAAGTSSPLDAARRASAHAGLRLTAAHATLDELGALDRPCIIRLVGPEEAVVLVDVPGSLARIAHGGVVVVYSKSDIAERFQGDALVPEDPAQPAARASFERVDVDLGTIGVTGQFSLPFVLRNTGSSELRITTVPASCPSCGSISADREVLAPGEMGRVTIAYRPTHFGPIGSLFFVRTNDPLRGVVPITIRGSVSEGLLTDPESIWLRLEKGGTATAALRIRGPNDAKQPPLVELDLQFAQAAVRTLGTGIETVWMAQITAAAPVRPGGWQGTAVVRQTAGGPVLATVPIRVDVLPELTVTPAALFLGAVPKGRPVDRGVRVQSRTGAPFRVQSVRTSAAWLVAGPPVAVAGGLQIPISIRPDTPGLLEGSIDVKTDVPGEETVSIRVTGWVGSL